MRASKCSEDQIIGFLRQAEVGMPIKEIGRKHGFSDASFYQWRSKYGGMDASEAKQLRELELVVDVNYPDRRIDSSVLLPVLTSCPTQNAYIESFNGTLRDECSG